MKNLFEMSIVFFISYALVGCAVSAPGLKSQVSIHSPVLASSDKALSKFPPGWTAEELKQKLVHKWTGIESPKIEARGGGVITLTIKGISPDLKSVALTFKWEPPSVFNTGYNSPFKVEYNNIRLFPDADGNPTISWERLYGMREFTYKNGKLYGILQNRRYLRVTVLEQQD